VIAAPLMVHNSAPPQIQSQLHRRALLRVQILHYYFRDNLTSGFVWRDVEVNQIGLEAAGFYRAVGHS
jgi:hypothetical protein